LYGFQQLHGLVTLIVEQSLPLLEQVVAVAQVETMQQDTLYVLLVEVLEE
jgi:hypothetical protein